jgi:hypothetical protein
MPVIASDGCPVIRYPFDLRPLGNTVRLQASVQVMTGDGAQTEEDPPTGYEPPEVRAWVTPAGVELRTSTPEVAPDEGEGHWFVEIPIQDDVLLRVVVSASAV